MCCWSGPSFLFSVTNVSGQKKKEVTQQQQYTHQVIIRVGRTLWPLSLWCGIAKKPSNISQTRKTQKKKRNPFPFAGHISAKKSVHRTLGVDWECVCIFLLSSSFNLYETTALLCFLLLTNKNEMKKKKEEALNDFAAVSMAIRPRPILRLARATPQPSCWALGYM